jgi:TRAP-type C4-dicarboxylate transport system substrate-binding protein
MKRSVGCLLALLLTGAAEAEPVTLRMAAVAPEGTAWAREIKGFAREVESNTNGEVKVKWYLGGIAGDELTALERMRHGQLDGAAGAIFCQRLAPSLRVVRLVGLFQSRDEVAYVLGRLKPTLDDEFRKSGFFNLGEGIFGVDMLFSRKPVRTMAELRAGKWWVWNLDPIWMATLPAMGARMAASSLDELSQLYRSGGVDGFFAVPSAALAYQWSTQATHFVELNAAVLPACAVISNSAFDPLPVEAKQKIAAAAAKFMNHFNAINAQLDEQLVDGLFEKQGLIKTALSAELRAAFYAAARAAREQLGEQLVPRALLAEVEKMLSEYRHHEKGR